tara:strand:- start:20 stop:181 length:162 start_codon:yes stop_codon:yes gene_type:complete
MTGLSLQPTQRKVAVALATLKTKRLGVAFMPKILDQLQAVASRAPLGILSDKF